MSKNGNIDVERKCEGECEGEYGSEYKADCGVDCGADCETALNVPTFRGQEYAWINLWNWL